MTKFKIGDTVVATETRKIVSIVEHDSHPYRLSDGNWYTEEQLQLKDDQTDDDFKYTKFVIRSQKQNEFGDFIFIGKSTHNLIGINFEERPSILSLMAVCKKRDSITKRNLSIDLHSFNKYLFTAKEIKEIKLPGFTKLMFSYNKNIRQ